MLFERFNGELIRAGTAKDWTNVERGRSGNRRSIAAVPDAVRAAARRRNSAPELSERRRRAKNGVETAVAVVRRRRRYSS